MDNYEDSAFNDKRRDVDCFMNWIESHVSKMEVVSNYKDIVKRHKRKHSHMKSRKLGKRRITGGRTRRKIY